MVYGALYHKNIKARRQRASKDGRQMLATIDTLRYVMADMDDVLCIYMRVRIDMRRAREDILYKGIKG